VAEDRASKQNRPSDKIVPYKNESPARGRGLRIADVRHPILSPLSAVVQEAMDYPPDFSRQAKAKVEDARIAAKKELLLSKNISAHLLFGILNPGGPAVTYIESIFYVYAREACKLGRAGSWDVDRVDREVLKATDSLVREAHTECRDLEIALPPLDIINRSSGLVSTHFWKYFKKGTIWWKYQNWLSDVAKKQSRRAQKQAQPSFDRGASVKPDDGPRFLNRARWLRDRLLERNWSSNQPSLFGGPDHKTIKRILHGLSVQDGTLDKLITALNKVGKWDKIRPEHVPSD
jgi:hypothetical protein